MSKSQFSRRGFLGIGLAGSIVAAAGPAFAQTGLSRPDVIIGWTPWSDAEVVTKMAARILRDQMSKDVELTLADIGAQFRTVASGDIDLMMMSWEPGLHAPYLRKHGSDLVDLGTLYQGTIGLAVPEWVPTDLINSIEDLKKPEVIEALGGEITGIDPGAGLMATTREAMTSYALDGYSLTEGTGPKMVRSIAKSQRKEKPIVVTAWRPHAKFALYGMRYLEDPKGVFAQASEIHARGSRPFVERAPQIAGLIEAMSIEIEDIEGIMVQGREVGVDQAIENWIQANPEKVSSWL